MVDDELVKKLSVIMYLALTEDYKKFEFKKVNSSVKQNWKKIICKFKGHSWNTTIVISGNGKNRSYCDRCKFE